MAYILLAVRHWVDVTNNRYLNSYQSVVATFLLWDWLMRPQRWHWWNDRKLPTYGKCCIWYGRSL